MIPWNERASRAEPRNKQERALVLGARQGPAARNAYRELECAKARVRA